MAKATHVDTCVQEIFHERVFHKNLAAQTDVSVMALPEGGYKITWIGRQSFSEDKGSRFFESKEDALDMARQFVAHIQAS